MLIRSQNGIDLMKLDDLSICEFGDYRDIRTPFAVVCYKEGNSHCNLGGYSTEEKAKKVLDMIQYAYERCERSIYNNYAEEGNRLYTVFQMPQDDEVEV